MTLLLRGDPSSALTAGLGTWEGEVQRPDLADSALTHHCGKCAHTQMQMHAHKDTHVYACEHMKRHACTRWDRVEARSKWEGEER